jgi:multidrug efflux pump
LISRFFIDRAIFGAVLSIVIRLAGGVAVFTLPIAQYPDITPPTILVSCVYPGASAKVVAETVAAPIEQQVNGVEDMLYRSSQSVNDGSYTLTITFRLGVDVNQAQVLVQNRVSLAMPSLPDMVKQTGVTAKKKSPGIMLVVNLISPNGRYDQLYLSNYATVQIKDELARLEGVGDITFMGQRDYSMRLWLDPQQVASRNLTTEDIVNVVKEQNVQVAAGQIGQPPVPRGQAFQYTMSTLGRLADTEQFADMIAKTTGDGRLVRMRDVARPELGAQACDPSCTKDGEPSVALSVHQLPGSNALQTADGVRAKMAELKKRFPEGLDYAIVYDTTPFIKESITEVFKTLRDAVILVGIVVLVFLQNWRSTLIPLIAVPVAIIGTFAVMAGMGFSLNNLSLFGLVLAIGIVVDDAIVVVEAVEHHIEHGLTPREAAQKAMDQVSGPVIAVALVLCAVFVPCAFIAGITGRFFRQFAMTIAVSTVISAFNSLTLSPALAALLLKPKGGRRDPLMRLLDLVFGWFFRLFNLSFGVSTSAYTWLVRRLLRVSAVVLLAYVGLLYLTYWGFQRVPTGFIPPQDKRYLLVNLQLPDSASSGRTQDVISRIERIALATPGVGHTIAIAGQSILLNANAPNFGAMYVMLKDFHDRRAPELSGDAIAARLLGRCLQEIDEGQVAIFGAPPVNGASAHEAAAQSIVNKGNDGGGLTGLFTSYRANTPWFDLAIDRTKVKSLGVSLSEVFETLQVNLGGYHVNDFNKFGRTWEVNLQADSKFRMRPEDVKQLKVRNIKGKMVPLGTFAEAREITGPVMVTRYAMYPAASINGNTAPGVSTGEAVSLMQKLAEQELSQSMTCEWTELRYMQILAGSTAMFVFAAAVVLVFLVLAAQYDSWSLPLAVILVVPMCLLCSVTGVSLAKMGINMFTQIGFVVLVGLASKNAILIVEFARSRREAGVPAGEATVEACQLRLRPILMTSFAFILGVLPLVLSEGAGAEMRRTPGTAVFSGMVGVTFFGVFLTPVFYCVIQAVTDWRARKVYRAPRPPPRPVRPDRRRALRAAQ